MSESINPYQPPGTAVVPEITADPLLPSRWKRFSAAVLDMAIAMVCAIPEIFYQIYILDIPWGEPVPFTHEVIVFIYSAAVFFAVNGYLLITRGQTVGKLALGIKISTMTLTKPSVFSLTVIRTYVFWLLSYNHWLALVGLVDLLFIFRKDKRCLHDHLARTTVIAQSVTYHAD